MTVKDKLNEMLDNWDDKILKIYNKSEEYKNILFDIWDEYIASHDEHLIGFRLEDEIMENWDYEEGLRTVIALEIDFHKNKNFLSIN